MERKISLISGVLSIILLSYISKFVNPDMLLWIVLFGLSCIKFGELD